LGFLKYARQFLSYLCLKIYLQRRNLMRKNFGIITLCAMVMVLAFGSHVLAANTANVTLTAPGIVKQGCEENGSVTFAFDGGTVITEGDWWYMDLEVGAELCKDINYIITCDDQAGGAGGYDLSDETDNLVVFGAATGLLDGTLGTLVGNSDFGPLSIENTGGGAAANVAVSGGAGMVFKVDGASGSRRVWVRVYSTVADSTITVPASHTLYLKILNGQAYINNIALDTDDGTAAEGDPDGIYGNSVIVTGDTIPAGALTPADLPVPYVENTLCANSEDMGGNDDFVSFDSLDNFLTFTGDSKIAHYVGTNPISLESCKGLTLGQFAPEEQGDCEFFYETGVGYCADGDFATQPREWDPGNDGGQRIYLQSASTFGDPGNQYEVELNVLTSGAYFSGLPVMRGYEPADSVCEGNNWDATVGAWDYENESGDTEGFPNSSCSVDSDERVRKVFTNTFTGIDGYHQLFIDLPSFVYDTSVLAFNTEVVLEVIVKAYPCGEIFRDTISIGTHVDTCPEGAAGSTLMFPFFPAMDGSQGTWWGGFAIVNSSAAGGTADLTFTEAGGDTATLTGISIAAGGMYFTTTDPAYLATLTAGAGFGNENCSMQAVCTFEGAAGFAFLGNMDEGTGYVPYTQDAGWD
jgi:hypothetical protein